MIDEIRAEIWDRGLPDTENEFECEEFHVHTLEYLQIAELHKS
jgi:hypothetical protein